MTDRTASNSRAILERSAILHALRQEGGQSVYKLHLATGFKHEQIKQSLAYLLETGAVACKPGPKCVPYFDLPDRDKPKPVYKGRPAGRITVPQFRWGGTRLG